MDTKLNIRVYKYKQNGIDTVVIRPDSKKYGLFQQDKNGNFTIDVLHKYYNLPPFNKGRFNFLYEQFCNEEVITELKFTDIISKVKKKLKSFTGQLITIDKHKDKYDIATLDRVSSETAKNILKQQYKDVNKKFDLHSLSKEELRVLLSFLWPHDGKTERSPELTFDKIVSDLDNKERLHLYVDQRPLYYLMSGIKL